MGLYVHVQYAGDWWGEDPLEETGFDTPGALFRALAGREKMYSYRALGRCTGKVYIDGPDGKGQQVGWVFVARNPPPAGRGDEQPTGRREAWVTVFDAPPTVTTVHHYHDFRTLAGSG